MSDTNQKVLTDQTVIVTGGSSGIGRGIALELAEHGANIVVADQRSQACRHAHRRTDSGKRWRSPLHQNRRH